jgi:hypothetical protein
MDNGNGLKESMSTAIEKSEELTQENVDLITYEMLPLAKKNLYIAILAFTIMAFIFPFSGGRNDVPSPNSTGLYWEAFVGFLIFGFVYVCFFIVRPILLLTKDLNSNRKKTIELEVLQKIRTNNAKFVIKYKKTPIKLKGDIILDKTEFYNWWKGDKLIVDYLIKTKLIIGFRKVNIE